MPTEEFNKAAEDVKNLSQKPTNDELLELYGLFKHTNCGDNNTEKPSAFWIKDRAKWDAWLTHKGKNVKETDKAYVELVNKLIEKYGLK